MRNGTEKQKKFAENIVYKVSKSFCEEIDLDDETEEELYSWNFLVFKITL